MFLELSHEGFFRGTTLGNPILGHLHNINSVNRKMVVDYHNNHYTGDNIIFLLSGNLSHEEVEGYLEEDFKDIQKVNNIQD